jgi:glycosyltransferase involved in cell wall biosynthesis
MLEAMACGTPVAAFPVPGPLDVVGRSPGGVLGLAVAREHEHVGPAVDAHEFDLAKEPGKAAPPLARYLSVLLGLAGRAQAPHLLSDALELV